MSAKIVGTTLATEPSLLPRRLPPVFQRGDGRLLVAVAGGDEPPRSDEDERFGQVDEDAVYRFDVPFEPRPNHLLLRVREDEDPEQIDRASLDQRLHELAWERLQECAQGVAHKSLRRAVEAAWYAVRATPEEPLPWLVVISLLRSEGNVEDAAELEDRVCARIERLPSGLEERLAGQRGARGALIELLNRFAGDRFDLMPGEGPRRSDYLRRLREGLRGVCA